MANVALSVETYKAAAPDIVGEALRERFVTLLEQHVSRLTVRGHKATGLCPFHGDRHPSFSANVEKGVWYCHACGKGGGVKAFAFLLGEEWAGGKSKASTPALRREYARVAIAARQRAAEATARAILQRRADEREDALWAEWCLANTDATQTAELLGFFHRRPDLANEFDDIVIQLERDYSDAVWRRSVIEFRASREVWQ
jgi:hypothetical protein